MVEIKHKHILEVAMALRFPGYILIIFCGECILVVFYLINRLPTEVLKDKLLFNGQKANIGNLRTIVCLWYATRMVKPNKHCQCWHMCYNGILSNSKGLCYVQNVSVKALGKHRCCFEVVCVSVLLDDKHTTIPLLIMNLIRHICP